MVERCDRTAEVRDSNSLLSTPEAKAGGKSRYLPRLPLESRAYQHRQRHHHRRHLPGILPLSMGIHLLLWWGLVRAGEWMVASVEPHWIPVQWLPLEDEVDPSPDDSPRALITLQMRARHQDPHASVGGAAWRRQIRESVPVENPVDPSEVSAISPASTDSPPRSATDPLAVNTLLAQLQDAVTEQNWQHALRKVDELMLTAPNAAQQLKAFRSQVQSLQATAEPEDPDPEPTLIPDPSPEPFATFATADPTPVALPSPVAIPSPDPLPSPNPDPTPQPFLFETPTSRVAMTFSLDADVSVSPQSEGLSSEWAATVDIAENASPQDPWPEIRDPQADALGLSGVASSPEIVESLVESLDPPQPALLATHSDWADYLARLQAQVLEYWLIQGTHPAHVTKIRLILGSLGIIESVQVMVSSDDALVDAAVISAIRQAAPFDPLPEGFERFVFELDVLSGVVRVAGVGSGE